MLSGRNEKGQSGVARGEVRYTNSGYVLCVCVLLSMRQVREGCVVVKNRQTEKEKIEHASMTCASSPPTKQPPDADV